MRSIDSQPWAYKLIAKLPPGARDAMNISWSTVAPNIRMIAWFGILTHPVYLTINMMMANGTEAPVLRLFSVAACIFVLSVRNVKPDLAPSPSVVLAFVAGFFVLPFFFFYVLFQNSINIETTDLQLASRQVQCAFSVMAISLLIYDARLLVFGLIGSFLVALLLFVGDFSAATMPRLVDGVFSQVPFWIFAIFGGVYFNRNRAVVESEKLKTLSAVGGHLAHELRTPLATIALKMSGAVKKIENSGKGDNSAVRNRSLDRTLDEVRDICSAVSSDTRYANALIDMFLIRAGMNEMREYEKTRFTVSQCIQESLSRYPFQGDSERSAIDLQIVHDFDIDGPFILFVHVILNLLKNSFSFVRLGAEPTIRIRAETVAGRGRLSVIDNGSGIAPENLEKVFSSFFTTSSAGEGTGVGLHFCRRVLRENGGDLHVTSTPNVKTEFCLDLPLLAA